MNEWALAIVLWKRSVAYVLNFSEADGRLRSLSSVEMTSYFQLSFRTKREVCLGLGTTASDGQAETEGSVSVAVPHNESPETCDAFDNGQDYDATELN